MKIHLGISGYPNVNWHNDVRYTLFYNKCKSGLLKCQSMIKISSYKKAKGSIIHCYNNSILDQSILRLVTRHGTTPNSCIQMITISLGRVATGRVATGMAYVGSDLQVADS